MFGVMGAPMRPQVFVPDAPSAVPQRDSVGTAEDVELLRSSASARVAAPLAREQGADDDDIPEWWNPSPALHVSLYYKQEVCILPDPLPQKTTIPCQVLVCRSSDDTFEHLMLILGSNSDACVGLQADKTAKAILKEIEDAKLAGYDYPISSLISLRQVRSLHHLTVPDMQVPGLLDQMISSLCMPSILQSMQELCT